MDEQGKPLLDGSVRVRRRSGSPPPEDSAWVGVGPDGRFEVTLPDAEPEPDTFGLDRFVDAEFYAPMHMWQSTSATIPSSEVVEFGAVKLVLGGRVTGTVLTPEGTPLVGALVTACSATRDNLEYLRESLQSKPYATRGSFGSDQLEALATRASGASVSAFSGEDGRFVLDGVPAGKTILVAAATCHAYRLSIQFPVVRGEMVEAAPLVPEPAPSSTYLSGVVLDPDGSPVPRARVALHGATRTSIRSWSRSYMLFADEQGRFSQCGLAPAAWTIEASSPRWASSGSRSVELGAREIVLRLGVKNGIRMRVTSRSGERLYDVSIERVLGNAVSRLRFASWKDWLEVEMPPEPAALRVGAPDHREIDLGVIDPREVRDVLEVVLDPLPAPPKCTGRVVDADGRPVHGAIVGLLHAEKVAGMSNGFPARSYVTGGLAVLSFPGMAAEAASWTRSPTEAALTNEDGFWSFGVEEQESYYLHISASGWSRKELGPIQLSPERPHDFGEVQLTRGGGLRGRVFDASGAPRAHVVVAVSRGDGRPSSTRTDADGWYSFDNLTPGPWFVRTQEEEILLINSEFSGGRRPTPFGFNTNVVEGSTTNFDLGKAARKHLNFQATIRLDGGPAVGWHAYLDIGERSETLEGELDSSGSVHWQWEEDSSEMATFFAEAPNGMRIGREVKLADLDRALVLDVETGELVVHGVPRVAEDGAASGAYCKFGDWMAVALLVSEDGTWRARVPAGDWRVVRGDEDTEVEDPGELPALNSGTLVPAGVLELHLP